MLVLAVNERDIGSHASEFIYTKLGQGRQGDIRRESRGIEFWLRFIVAWGWSCHRIVSQATWAADCTVIPGQEQPTVSVWDRNHGQKSYSASIGGNKPGQLAQSPLLGVGQRRLAEHWRQKSLHAQIELGLVIAMGTGTGIESIVVKAKPLAHSGFSVSTEGG